jgi:protein-S-isoprenylcysteine O-methyltransferase Ste14
MIETAVFILGSLGLIMLSRRALARTSSHGFPRFFAFEVLLGLVMLNARKWFINPLSLQQIISWALLLLAAYLATHSFFLLYTYGALDTGSEEADRLGLEKTTRLVTHGPYRYIRHPLYTSLLCLAWGVFMKQINLQTGLLVTIISTALCLTAVYEERENVNIFGENYLAYMRRTKRFIPFVI